MAQKPRSHEVKVYDVTEEFQKHQSQAGKARFWTHPSVLRFAGDRDPIEEVVSQASRITLAAIQAGWSGPPFDPFQLADHLRVRLAPREDVSDARIVQQPKGELQIEYNPNRPKARVRYSIAHDLAHSIFPDCGEMTRHRLSRQ